MKSASAENIITRKEIEAAMKDFFNKGGKIKILPPQIFIKKAIIGGEKLKIYEDPETMITCR